MGEDRAPELEVLKTGREKVRRATYLSYGGHLEVSTLFGMLTGTTDSHLLE